MALHIIAIGKKHEQWVAEGISRYQKRLKSPFDVEWVLIPHSSLEDVQARQEESHRLLARLPAQAFVILLDETGNSYDSPAFSRLLDKHFTQSRDVWFVIGGAYGVDETMQERANDSWSLSPLVFPHQLVRLMVIEQVYRAQQIVAGSGYHHQ